MFLGEDLRQDRHSLHLLVDTSSGISVKSSLSLGPVSCPAPIMMHGAVEQVLETAGNSTSEYRNMVPTQGAQGSDLQQRISWLSAGQGNRSHGV